MSCVYLVPFWDADVWRALDTIDSIRCYAGPGARVVCLDDCSDSGNAMLVSGSHRSERLRLFSPNASTGWPKNTYGSLFCKKYQAIEFCAKEFDFKYLIGMDTDALLIGPGLGDAADEYLSKQAYKKVGLLGSYRLRADGLKRTRWEWALRILWLRFLGRGGQAGSVLWSELIPKARRNGYRLGEHVLGGGFVLSSACLKEMLGLYPFEFFLSNRFFELKIGDDVLLSLLVFASGFSIGDFGGPGDPLALAHKHLPLDKQEALERRKLLIHSVKRGYSDEPEAELRSFFREVRRQGGRGE